MTALFEESRAAIERAFRAGAQGGTQGASAHRGRQEPCRNSSGEPKNEAHEGDP